jgi:hypothetical protein
MGSAMTKQRCASDFRKSRPFRPEHASAIVRERAKLIGNTQRAAEAKAHQGRIKPTLPRLSFLKREDGQ